MNKTTKEYAEKLAGEKYITSNVKEIDAWHSALKSGFISGYLSAVEETGVRELPTDQDIAIEIVATFLHNPHPNQRKNYEREKEAFAKGAKWMREQIEKKLKQ